MLWHLVAKAYATTPAAVRDWPADDFLTAVRLLPFDRPGRREHR